MNRVSSSPAIACGQRNVLSRAHRRCPHGRWHPTDQPGRRRVRRQPTSPPQHPAVPGVRDPEDPSDQAKPNGSTGSSTPGFFFSRPGWLHGVEVHLPDDTHRFREGFVRDAVEHQQAVVPGICDNEIAVNDRDAGGRYRPRRVSALPAAGPRW